VLIFSKEIQIDYEILETFLCEEEKQYFIKWDREWMDAEWDREWMDAVGGYGYEQKTHSLVTYYITKNGHITVYIPVDEYLAKFNAKERDKKLESIGI